MASREVTYHISTTSVIKVIAIFALTAAIFFLRDLVLVVLTAVVVASAIEPGTKWLMKRRFPRVLAVITQYLVLALALSLLFYFLVIPVLGEAANLVRALPKYAGSAALEPGGAIDGGALRGFSLQQIFAQINAALDNLSRGFFSTISTVFGGVVSFVLILVLSFYLSVQERGIERFLASVTPIEQRAKVISLWNRSERKIGRWMQGQIILAVIVFVMVYVGLLAFRVEHALLLAALAGAFEVIPLIGPVIAAIPGVTLAFLGGGVSTAVFVIILYFLVQQMENHIIYPLVMKKVIGVSPIFTIVALIAGSKLFGFLGLVLAVPISAVLVEFYNDLQLERQARESRLASADKE